MTSIYKVQRKHGEKWYAKVNYTIAGIHYQKKSSVFDTQKEARMAEIELQEWVRQVIQEAELGQADVSADMPQEVTQRRTEPLRAVPEHTDTATSAPVTKAQKRPQRLVAPTYGQVWEEYRNTPKIKGLKRSSLKAKDDFCGVWRLYAKLLRGFHLRHFKQPALSGCAPNRRIWA